MSCVFVSATNRALVVGIGNYDTDQTGWSKIHGDADVPLIVKGLKLNGFKASDIRTLVNRQATKENIISELTRLCRDCRRGDKVFFHFSGHGQPIVDLNKDESKEFDESIVPYDAYRSPKYKIGDRQYQGENHLIDDELNRLLNNIKIKIGSKGVLFVSMDACFSQGLEMDNESGLSMDDLEIAGSLRGTSHKFKIRKSAYLTSLPQPVTFGTGGRLIVVSACKHNERNFEYKDRYGSLSYYISTLLASDADFSRWEKCFRNKSYLGSNIFVSIQHPTVKVYK